MIFNFVKEEFTRHIGLEEITEKVSITTQSCLLQILKITGKTFTQFVNEYRLAHAAKLLHEKQISIPEVCYESGFNKQFKNIHRDPLQLTGMN